MKDKFAVDRFPLHIASQSFREVLQADRPRVRNDRELAICETLRDLCLVIVDVLAATVASGNENRYLSRAERGQDRANAPVRHDHVSSRGFSAWQMPSRC